MSLIQILRISSFSLRIFCLLFSLLLFIESFNAQTPAPAIHDTKEAKYNRQTALIMLKEMKEVLEENYYDRNYRGIDLKARFGAAENRIKTLNYNWEVFRVLAQVLLDFNDSHTRLILPPRTDYFEYGFASQMIGDKCFVVNVKKGSDAEKKGLKVGDEILNIGKFSPTRSNLWKIMFVLYKLDPSKTIDLKVKSLGGNKSQMTITAKTMTERERKEERKKRKDEEAAKLFKCQEISAELIACKLYTFVVEKSQIDKMMKQIGAHPKLILDLRGNHGGLVTIEEYLTGYLFDYDVKIADIVTRKKTESRTSKSQKEKAFKGELAILVDSKSASAAEILARVVQIEKRGKVFGDVSSGAVMTSITVGLFRRLSALTRYVFTMTGMSVTIGDVIMKDGNRLENIGVIPDVTIGPTSFALAEKTDPVLAYTATQMGANLSPKKAGEFYFLTEKQEEIDESDVVEGN